MLKSLRNLVGNQAFGTGAAITTVQPTIQSLDRGFPAGEKFMTGLALRVYGKLNITASAAGANVTDGPLQFLRNVYFDTDKHGPIINNVDGISLARLHTFLNGVPPKVIQPSALTTADGLVFSESLNIPFAQRFALRPEDTHLYMKTARPKLTYVGGVFTDLVSGGTMSKSEALPFLQATSFELAEADGGPLKANDMPLYVPFVELKKVSITTTTSGFKIELPYGDRIYQMLGISQRNPTTLAEVDNAVIVREANIRLEKNNQPIINTIQWADVQDETARMYKLASLPTGWGVLNFAGEEKKPRQISEMLNTVDTAAGTLNLFLDAVAGQGEIWILMMGYMPLRNKAAWSDLPAEITGAK